MSSQSRTAKLWIQYLDYVDLVKMFVRAERTGNWSLHLVAVSRMINLFAATGHINYAKSARLYLQLMLELPTDYPWVYQSFAEHGYHTVRRSDRYWAGLWTDLIIEQVMMRSIKSRGGLTRGRGMTETVRLVWIHSMHRCGDIHNAMTVLTGAQHRTSEQHIELGESRIRRDNADLEKIKSWFDQYNPFQVNEPNLRSLTSGLTSSDEDQINCDNAELVGYRIQKSLDNVSIDSASIKRNDQVRTLEYLQNPIKVGKENVRFDPMLLFNRLILLAQREDDMAGCFNYELTPSPTSLFKDGLMRKANKAMLKKAITQNIEPSEENPYTMYVIDGGALLHKVKWIPNSTYLQVADQYLTYVRTKYGRACVVFDGYEAGPSTKDHEHIRRSGNVAPNISVKLSNQAHKQQEAFLKNEHNKTQLIKILTEKFKEEGHHIRNSESDADTLIVSTAIDYARNENVTVVADDTDILVLLMFHWRIDLKEVYFKSEGSRKRKSNVWNIRVLSEHHGSDVSDNILFIHAWSGCDTTSATYKKG